MGQGVVNESFAYFNRCCMCCSGAVWPQSEEVVVLIQYKVIKCFFCVGRITVVPQSKDTTRGGPISNSEALMAVCVAR